MPINLDQVFQQAAGMGDSAKLFLSQDGQQVSQHSGLHGLQRLSISARNSQSMAAVDALRVAIANDPRYATLMTSVSSQLDSVLNQGKPLTAQALRQTQLILDVAKSVEIGRGLATDGKLPAGHGASFGQYAVAHSLPLSTPKELATAVKEYLLNNVVPQNVVALSKLPGLGEKTESIQAIMTKMIPPNGSKDGVFGQFLEESLTNDINDFSFVGLEHAYSRANQEPISLLCQLDVNILKSMVHMPAANILQTMRDAQATVPAKNMSNLIMFMMSNMARVDTPTARAACIRDFMVREATADSAKAVLADHGLPESFHTAAGFHPSVQKAIVAALVQDPGAGSIPTSDRVQAAVTQCIENFVTGHEPLLREFAIMAGNPPVDLQPPLTPANMARYINTMIAGDAVLEPLLNDSVPIDAEFMKKVADLGESMNSAAHSLKGDFGADDAAKVLDNSIRLLLARRGVSTEDYPAMMDKAMTKFGKAASDLMTLNSAVQRGFGGAQGMTYLLDGMSAFRALEGFGRALIHIMPREQLVPLGVCLPVAPDPTDEDAMRAEGTLLSNFIEKTFQNEGKMNELPDYMRTFGNMHGFHLPPLDPAVAARVQQQQADGLAQTNAQAGTEILQELVEDPGQGNGRGSVLFRSHISKALENHDLAGINPDLVNPRPLYQAMHAAVQAEIARATAAGEQVNPAVLRQLATDALIAGCVKLKDTLNSIDNLPTESTQEFPTVITTEQRDRMKTAVQSTGIRDVQVVYTLCTRAANENTAGYNLRRMSAPVATGGQLAQAAVNIGRIYRDAKTTLEKLPQNDVTQDDALRLIAQFSLSDPQLSPSTRRTLADNLNSATAKEVAGAFLMAGKQPGVHPVDADGCSIAVSTMNELRMAVALVTGGPATVDRSDDFFSAPLQHLSQIKGGYNSCMTEVQSAVHDVYPRSAIILARVGDHLSLSQWDIMMDVINSVTTRMGDDIYKQDVMTHLVSNAYQDVLEAVKANGGNPLSDAQIWKALMGTAMPSQNAGIAFGDALLTAMESQYTKMHTAAGPNTQPGLPLFVKFEQACMSGLSFQSIIKALQPGATLHLADVGYLGESVSSMRDYHEGNAYGLVTDYRRWKTGTEFRFESTDGQALTLRPGQIEDEDNTPEFPLFQDIMGKVRSMTQSHEQFARVMQMYSQASTVGVLMLSQAFPGVRMDEHGEFSIHSQAQADGSVLVDIDSSPDAPLACSRQFRIHADGTYTCLKCDFTRR